MPQTRQPPIRPRRRPRPSSDSIQLLNRMPDLPCPADGGTIKGTGWVRICLHRKGHLGFGIPHAWSNWTAPRSGGAS